MNRILRIASPDLCVVSAPRSLHLLFAQPAMERERGVDRRRSLEGMNVKWTFKRVNRRESRWRSPLRHKSAQMNVAVFKYLKSSNGLTRPWNRALRLRSFNAVSLNIVPRRKMASSCRDKHDDRALIKGCFKIVIAANANLGLLLRFMAGLFGGGRLFMAVVFFKYQLEESWIWNMSFV